MDLVKGLNRRGVYVGLQHITDPQFAALAIPRHRLGAVILIAGQISSVEEEFMEQVNMFIRSVSICKQGVPMGYSTVSAFLLQRFLVVQIYCAAGIV